jgi:hypothetical protein
MFFVTQSDNNITKIYVGCTKDISAPHAGHEPWVENTWPKS